MGKYEKLLSKITLLQESINEIKADIKVMKVNNEYMLDWIKNSNVNVIVNEIAELKIKIKELNTLINRLISLHNIKNINKNFRY